MADGKEYISCPDELGSIHISEDVLAVTAAAAALEDFFARCPRALEVKRQMASNAAQAGRDVVSGGDVAAALEVEGVGSLAANLGSDIAELLAGKKNLSKGVRITVTESSVTVDISLLVKYGSSVQATARAVQEGVAAAIENASGFTVEGVNVHVAGVTFERPARTNQ